MANITITNNDLGNVILESGQFADDKLLTLAGADVIAEGTILAIDSVSLKYVLFVKGGLTNENGIPKAVMTYGTESSGAGDIAIRPMISGVVRKERLVIDADGDASNVDQAVEDQLRDYSIVVKSVTELNELDNQ